MGTGESFDLLEVPPNVFPRLQLLNPLEERQGVLEPGLSDENLRMAEIPGAILGAQLAKLPPVLDLIARNTASIREAAADHPALGVPKANADRDRHALGVLCYLPDPDSAERTAAALRAEGVPAGTVYGGVPVYAARQILNQWTITAGCPFNCPSYFPEPVTYEMGMCPHSEDLLSRSVMISTGPFYTEEDLDDIIFGIQKVVSGL